MTQTAPAFVGWFRPRLSAAWTALAEGATYHLTLVRLLERRPAQGGELIVLPAGRTPDDDRPETPRTTHR